MQLNSSLISMLIIPVFVLLQWGNAALILAAARGHSNCVKFLLEHKANIEAVDKYVRMH